MIDEHDTPPGLTTPSLVLALEGANTREVIDELATEEPLEIRLVTHGAAQRIAVTMRTPGNDFELAAGFLLSEGVIRSIDDIDAISYCIDPAIDVKQRYNIVNVVLAAHVTVDFVRLERHFTITSACGICGKANIEALATRAQPIDDDTRLSSEFIAKLPEKMREAQRVFTSTGGLHAAALFGAAGTLLALREDVGRHNAVDKVIGWAILNGRVPLRGCVLLVSGRASYELVQKGIVAGVPALCAISAPSSLAVELARAFNLTLVGFVRGDRANVYAGRERVLLR